MHRRRHLLQRIVGAIVVTIGALPLCLPTQAQTLTPYSARYSTTAMGLGMTLERELVRGENGEFLLSNEGSVFIASLSERARFTIRDGQIQGDQFSYKLGGVVSRKREVQFLPEQGKIRSLRKKRWTEHEWEPAILDRLSQQEQLRLDLMATQEPPETLHFRVIDGPRVRERTLAYIGTETIDTKAGTFTTLHYEQVRDDDKRASDIWVAPALDYLMVKTVHIEDGSTISIELLDTSLGAPTQDEP